MAESHDIKLNVDASGAEQGFQRFTKAMSAAERQMQSFDKKAGKAFSGMQAVGDPFAGMANQAAKLSRAMNAFKVPQTKGLTNAVLEIELAAKALKALDVSTITKNLNGLRRAIERVGTIKVNTSSVQAAATGIGQAITKLNGLQTSGLTNALNAFRRAATSVSNLKFNTTNVDAAVNALQRAIGRLQGVNFGRVTTQLSALAGVKVGRAISNQIANLGNALQNFQGPNPASLAALARFLQLVNQANTANLQALALSTRNMNRSNRTLNPGGGQRPNPAGWGSAGNVLQGFTGKVHGASGALRGLENAFSTSYQMASMFRSAIGSITLGSVVKEVYDAGKAFNTLRFAVDAVATSSKDVPDQQAFIEKLTTQLPVGLRQAQSSYGKFYVSSKLSGIDTPDVQNIYTSFSKAFTVMHLGTEQQELAFLALEQMMSKGKIQAEELRRQLGQYLPGAFEILATSMGKSPKELDALMKKGQVASSELIGMAKLLEAIFGQQVEASLHSSSAQVGFLSTNFEKLKVAIFNNGFDRGLARMAASINAALKAQGIEDAGARIGAAFERIFDALGKVAIWAIQHWDALARIAMALAAISALGTAGSVLGMIGGGLGTVGHMASLALTPLRLLLPIMNVLSGGALATAFVRTGAAAAGTGAAAGAAAGRVGMLGAAAAGLGGPLGIAAAAVVALGAAYLLAKDDLVQFESGQARVKDVVAVLWENLADAVKSSLDRMRDNAQATWDSLMQDMPEWARIAMSNTAAVVAGGVEIINKLWNNLGDSYQGALERKGDVSRPDLWNKMIFGGLQESLEAAWELTKLYVDKISGTVETAAVRRYSMDQHATFRRGEYDYTNKSAAADAEAAAIANDPVKQKLYEQNKQREEQIKENKNRTTKEEILKSNGASNSDFFNIDKVQKAKQEFAAINKALDEMHTKLKPGQDGYLDDKALAAKKAQAELHYRDQMDPYGKITRDLEQENRLLGMNKNEREIERDLLQKINELKKEGIDLTTAENAGLQDQLRQLITKQKELDKGGATGFQQWANNADSLKDKLNEVEKQGIDQLADTMADFLTDGEADWEAFGKSIVRSINKALIESMIAEFIKGTGGLGGFSLAGLFGVGGSSGGGNAAAGAASAATGAAGGGGGLFGAPLIDVGGALRRAIGLEQAAPAAAVAAGTTGATAAATQAATQAASAAVGKVTSAPLAPLAGAAESAPRPITMSEFDARFDPLAAAGAPKMMPPGANDNIAGLANRWGIADSTINKFYAVESGYGKFMNAPTSSAAGLGQFTKGTWADYIVHNRPDIAQGRSMAALSVDQNVQNMRMDSGMMYDATGWLANRNAGALTKAGLPVNDANLYAAHFAGNRGIKALQADPNAALSSILSEKQMVANAATKFNGKTFDQFTAGDFQQWTQYKMGAGAQGVLDSQRVPLDARPPGAGLAPQPFQQLGFGQQTMPMQMPGQMAGNGTFGMAPLDMSAVQGQFQQQFEQAMQPALQQTANQMTTAATQTLAQGFPFTTQGLQGLDQSMQGLMQAGAQPAVQGVGDIMQSTAQQQMGQGGFWQSLFGGMGGGGGGGGIGGIFSGLFGGGMFKEGGYSDAPVSTGFMPMSAFAGAPHFAEGTTNTSGGMPAILHDNEAVIPLSRGRKVPVELTGSESNDNTSGQTVINVKQNFTTPDVNSFRSSRRQIQADTARMLQVAHQRNN